MLCENYVQYKYGLLRDFPNEFKTQYGFIKNKIFL